MNPCDTPLSPFTEVIKGYKIFLEGISCAVCASCCLTLTVTKACGGAPAIICKGSAVSHSTIFSLLFHYFLMGVPVLLPAAAAVCVSVCFSCRSRHLVTTVNRSSAAQMKQKDLRQGERGGATSIKCTAVQTLASFCCTDIFTSFQSSTQRQYFFQSLR